MSAKNELALLDAEIMKKKAEIQQQINKEKTHELNNQIEIVNRKLVEAKSLNKKYQQQLQAMKKEKEEQLQVINRNAEQQKYTSSVKNTKLSDEEKLKISNLLSQIGKIQQEQDKAKISAYKLNEILTYSSLNGLWKDSSIINGKNVYIEFLPKGLIRTYAGLDGEEYTFSN